MKTLFFTLSLLLSTTAFAQDEQPLCVTDSECETLEELVDSHEEAINTHYEKLDGGFVNVTLVFQNGDKQSYKIRQVALSELNNGDLIDCSTDSDCALKNPSIQF